MTFFKTLACEPTLQGELSPQQNFISIKYEKIDAITLSLLFLFYQSSGTWGRIHIKWPTTVVFFVFFELGMSIECEVDLLQRSWPELKSSLNKPHINSTFSQYREHEVCYKKYTEDIVNMHGDFVQHVIIGGNAWLSFAFRDLGLIISRSHVRVLFHVFCSLKSVAFLGFCSCLCFCPDNYWLKSTRDEMKRWNHGEPIGERSSWSFPRCRTEKCDVVMHPSQENHSRQEHTAHCRSVPHRLWAACKQQQVHSSV